MTVTVEPKPTNAATQNDPRRPRWLFPALGVAALVLTVLSAGYIDFAPTTLIEGLEDVGNLLERMLPPRVDDTGRIVSLALDTLLMAVLGTVLAAVVSVPLAFLAARNTSPHPVLYSVARAVITFCRAMPDLLFAVLFVRALGIGVLPGILALALHSIGMLGKLFADAIEETDVGPREALRAAGAGYYREMINAVVPQVVPAWIGAFVYRIDINLRMSVVLGFVGAGGIGFALQDALRGLIYPRALGIVLVILVIIAAMELAAMALRRMLLVPSAAGPQRDRVMRIGASAVLVLAIVASFVVLELDPRSLLTWIGPSIEVFGRMVPPDFSALGADLFDAAVQTVAIGVVALAILPVGVIGKIGRASCRERV